MKLSVKLFFAWFDFWIGFYWDREKRALYVAPLPCVVFKIERASRLLPGMCKCGHGRDMHIDLGCLGPNDKNSWSIYCPCRMPRESIRTAGPPPRGILSEIGD